MKKNLGSMDRILRILATATIVYLYYRGNISGTLGVVLLVVGAVFTLTSFIGICPLYLPFGLRSNKIPEK